MDPSAAAGLAAVEAAAAAVRLVQNYCSVLFDYLAVDKTGPCDTAFHKIDVDRLLAHFRWY